MRTGKSFLLGKKHLHNFLSSPREGVKNSTLRGHVRGEGSTPLLIRIFNIKNVRNIQHALKTFFIKQLFFIVTPSFRATFKSFFLFSLSALRGGG